MNFYIEIEKISKTNLAKKIMEIRYYTKPKLKEVDT